MSHPSQEGVRSIRDQELKAEWLVSEVGGVLEQRPNMLVDQRVRRPLFR